MKRSRLTALVLMGAAPLLLAACSQEPELQTAEGLFTSVVACIDKTQNPHMCNQAFTQAQQQAAEAAPQFASVHECESQFGQGQCGMQQTTGGQSFIGPLMTGFFLSQMLTGRGAGLTQSAASAPPPGTSKSEPAFRTAHNDWLKPGPSAGGAGAAALTRVDAQPDRAMTVRRGGFGEGGSAPSLPEINSPNPLPHQARHPARSGRSTFEFSGGPTGSLARTNR